MKEILDEYLSQTIADFKDVIAHYKESHAPTAHAMELLRLREEQKAKNKQTNKKNRNKKTADLCFLDYLPFKSYVGQFGVFENENTIGFILRTSHFSAIDLKAKMALKSIIENDIPESCVVQVINYASPRIGNIIDYWADNATSNDSLLGKITNERAKFLKTGHWQSVLPRRSFVLRDYELYFSFSLPKSNLSNVKNLYYSLNDLQEKIVEGFKGINSDSMILNEFELAGFLQEIVNPNTSLYKNTNEHNKNSYENFSDYFQGSHQIEMKKDKIIFTGGSKQNEKNEERKAREESEKIKKSQKNEEKYVSKGLAEDNNNHTYQTPYQNNKFSYVVLEAISFPKSWRLENSLDYIGHFDSDFTFPCPFYISFGFSLLSRDKSIRSADKQRIIVTKQGDSKLPMFFPGMSVEIDDRHYVSGKLSQGERMGKSVMYIVLCLNDEANEDKHIQSVIAHFARLEFELIRVNYDILNHFIHSLPFGMGEAWKNLDQQKLPSKMLSSSCMNLMPVFGDVKNYANPLMILTGRKGELFFFDNYKTFSEANCNYNMIVVGKSGSGKSVFLEEYAIQILRIGGQVVIIDDGRSFENPCKAYGGDFVDFGGGSFCINPFSLYREQDDNEKSDEYQEYFEEPFIDLIVSILCILINLDKNDNTNPENGLYRSLMRIAVGEVMKIKGSNGGFADIRNQLLNNPNLRTKQTEDIADKIAFVLMSYSDGREKNYFNGEATISITNYLSVFEFSDLEHNELLQNSVLLVLVFLVYSKMRKRERRTSLIIDEAWRLLKHPAMKGFIAGIARRARKYDGCLIVATQTMSDFDKSESEAAATVLSQSTWRVILSVDDSDYDILKHKLGMSDAEIDIAKSMSGLKGAYSEFMIRHVSGNWQIGRLLLDRFSAKLYSTTASDVREIKNLQQEGSTVVEAIERLL
jgi:conjugal transfer ATP-binding protein TraC